MSGSSKSYVLEFFLGFPVDHELEHAAEFTQSASINPLIRTNSSQLHVHEPEELTFVEQYPRTRGGPGNLTQTAFPTGLVPKPSDVLALMTGVLFVLS
jgi:hypothetical protein